MFCQTKRKVLAVIFIYSISLCSLLISQPQAEAEFPGSKTAAFLEKEFKRLECVGNEPYFTDRGEQKVHSTFSLSSDGSLQISESSVDKELDRTEVNSTRLYSDMEISYEPEEDKNETPRGCYTWFINTKRKKGSRSIGTRKFSNYAGIAGNKHTNKSDEYSDGFMFTLGGTESDQQHIKRAFERLLKLFNPVLQLHYVIKGCDIADDPSSDNPEVEMMVNKAIKGYRAGLADMGKESFLEAVKTDPLFLYGNNYWYDVHQNQLPLSLTGEIFLAVNSEMEGNYGFWFDYAHTANLAAQPVLALIAVKKLEQLSENISDEKERKHVQNITAVLKANAYIQMGRDKDAYAALFVSWKSDKSGSAIVNYINNWARPLLKDKKKLSVLTGIEESKFTGKYAIPKPQAFQNIETGKLITPAEPPKLETKSVATEPQASTQPVQEKREPDVMVLD